MSLRGSLAGTLAFGLTVGLSVALLSTNGWSLSGIPFLTWFPLLVAILLTLFTLSSGGSFVLVATALLLFWAAARLAVAEGAWSLPLGASVGVLLAARLSGIGWTAHQVARGLGLFAMGALLWLVAHTAGVGDGLAPGEPAFLVAAGLLSATVLLSWWPRGSPGGA